MTSNVPPPSAASGGRRRALGRGPGTPPAAPAEAPPEPSEAPAEPPETPAEPSEAPGEGAGRPARPETPVEPSGTPGDGAEPSAEPGTPVEPSGGIAEAAPGPARTVEPSEKQAESSEPSEVSDVPGGGHESSAGPGTPDGPPEASPEGPGPSGAPLGPSGVSAEASDGAAAATGDGVFKVRLSNFEGPFDLLLQLISKHKLDVTEVALSKVTDEFMAHIRAMGPDWDLDQTTEFLVVAATLLDLKAARLLPTAEVEDEADLALLEARDLLFARLLQYRAYKQIADIFNARLEEEARRYPRTVGLEAHHAELLPEVVISIGAEGFAKLAVKAMQPRPKPQVYVDHIHAPLVSVQEQAQIVVALLRERGEASFRSLVEDTDDTLTVVARFLALLELYREKVVALDQKEALGDLMVRWTGGEGDDRPRVTDEFDRPAEAVKDEARRGTKEEKA
ncbi:segregation/condensation protein A [Streptomyces sp. NPDC002935]|uniref:segregation and condensation protein A n=1 Tax=unclassified Streptomyces TaxID=2593676 RepID=UPI003328C427